VRRANEQRFSERLGNQYEQYRQQRLANSESECRKMIADITTRLTQAGTLHPAPVHPLRIHAGEGCLDWSTCMHWRLSTHRCS